MLAAVWIWPKLRIWKVWLVVCLLATLGTVAWLLSDLNGFEAGAKSSNLGMRLLYVALSETDKPLIQLALGSCFATLFSFFRRPKADSRVSELEANEV